MKMKINDLVSCRYKSQNKHSDPKKLRKLKITKTPHYSKKYTKGKIIRAKDLSDPKKSDLEKVFYMKNLNLEEIFSEGNPP
tara:strand:+ start:550 stop:792 length:243 start_codon:yes stop_codon:yes gene_type:complete